VSYSLDGKAEDKRETSGRHLSLEDCWSVVEMYHTAVSGVIGVSPEHFLPVRGRDQRERERECVCVRERDGKSGSCGLKRSK